MGLSSTSRRPRFIFITKERSLSRYVCNICGFIYDPQAGDLDSGISPGTPFEDIPDDWVCPECGAVKDQFTIID
jgi:rubredoxin